MARPEAGKNKVVPWSGWLTHHAGMVRLEYASQDTHKDNSYNISIADRPGTSFNMAEGKRNVEEPQT